MKEINIQLEKRIAQHETTIKDLKSIPTTVSFISSSFIYLSHVIMIVIKECNNKYSIKY